VNSFNIGTMASIAFFFLFVFLTTFFASVESLRVPSAPHASSLIKVASTRSKKRLKHCYLNQAKDDNESEGMESSASLDGAEVDLDWKAIADYVFDESIESAETMTVFQEENESENQNDESQKSEAPHLHSKPIILFDGVCNLCNGGVNFAIDYDKNAKFRFASLQSNVAKSLLLRDGKDPETTSDVVLVTSEKAYYSSEAVARIMAGLDMPVLKILGVLGQVTPSFARNAVYKVVSGNRFLLGESDSCRMDFDGEYTSRFVSDPPQAIISNNEDKKEDK